MIALALSVIATAAAALETNAIKADYTTRVADCTLCQSCGGVCPSHSIKYVSRWNFSDLKEKDQFEVFETVEVARSL